MFQSSVRQVVLGFTIFGVLAVILLSASTDSISAQVPMEPIAYGYLLEDGSNETSTFNVSSTFYNSNAGQYEITIDGVDYFYSDFVTVVTPGTARNGQPLIASTSSVGGNLVVVLQDVAGNHVQGDFQFVIYQP